MKPNAKPPPLSMFEKREIALRALVDNRTLERALAGEAIRPLGLERIRRALAERGLEHLLPRATP